jgi:hypothetical protein
MERDVDLPPTIFPGETGSYLRNILVEPRGVEPLTS